MGGKDYLNGWGEGRDLFLSGWEAGANPVPLLSLQLRLFQHALLRGVYLLGIPVAMNLLLFYLHFLLLTQAGPGNAFVSIAFRNSLEASDVVS